MIDCQLELTGLHHAEDVCGACEEFAEHHPRWANRNDDSARVIDAKLYRWETRNDERVRKTPSEVFETLDKAVHESRKKYEDVLRGAKYDDGKQRPDLFPWEAFRSLLAVMEYGAKKYSAHSWLNVPNAEERYKNALMRHVIDLAEGKDVDEESGCLTLAHIAINCCFLITFRVRRERR